MFFTEPLRLMEGYHLVFLEVNYLTPPLEPISLYDELDDWDDHLEDVIEDFCACVVLQMYTPWGQNL